MKRFSILVSTIWLATCGGGGGSPTEPKLQLPSVQNIAFTVEEDSSATFSFLGTDPLSQTLTYSLSSQPQNGQIQINASSAVYTPNPNFNGVDTFAYFATNSDGNSNIGSIVATITQIDDQPQTSDIAATTNEDEAIDIAMNLTELDGDNVVFTIIENPSNGTVSFAGTIATYSPNQNWYGTDTFTFQVEDSNARKILNSATATITVNSVNDAPEVTNVNASVNSLADVEGDELTFSIVNDVSNGSTSLSGSIVTYTPNANYNGTDTFTYKANDGQLDSNTASGTITVTDVNPAISFSATPTTGTKDLRVVFTNNSTDYSSVLWDFGDGSTSTENSPVYIYNNNGVYDITVTLDSDLGSTSEVFEDYIIVDNISLPALVVDSKYNYTSIGKNVNVQLKVLGVTELTSAQMVLNYSISDLTLNSAVAGDFLEGNTAPMFISEVIEDSANNTNSLKIFTSTLSADKPSVSGDGILATLNFTIESSTQDDIISILSFDEIASQILLDINGDQIATEQTVDGYFINE
jgi:PKD repeat protein